MRSVSGSCASASHRPSAQPSAARRTDSAAGKLVAVSSSQCPSGGTRAAGKASSVSACGWKMALAATRARTACSSLASQRLRSCAEGVYRVNESRRASRCRTRNGYMSVAAAEPPVPSRQVVEERGTLGSSYPANSR